MATWPRRDTPARSIAGNSRPSRCHSETIDRRPPSPRSAVSMGTGVPFPDGAETDISHTPPASGGSSCTISFGRVGSVTVRDHCSSRLDIVVARLTLARNGVPSMRAITVSSRSIGDFALGGCAGRSARPMLSAMIASTAAVITADVVVRGLPPSTAATAPGIAAASVLTTDASSRAGPHRTLASTVPPSGRLATRRLGSTAPRAASRTPSKAARPSHRTLGPIPSLACPPPIATSHPSASFIGIATASAFSPPGSGTPACNCHPTDGPPIDSSRVASSSFPSAGDPRPAAHTTTCPADHEAWSCTGSGSQGSEEIGKSSSAS